MKPPFNPLVPCLFLDCAVLAGLSATPAIGQPADPKLQPVPFTDVRVTDAFWAPRIRINRAKVLPHNFKFCEQTGRISNFVKAAGQMPGPFEGIYFNDSDVYKVLEGTAYSLAHQRDAGPEATADEVIAKIAAAQQPDGYLYTFYTVNRQLDKRWSDEKQMHETYCAGHLIEAAVAYYQATGKRTLLDVAIKLADHLDSVFGPDRKHDAPGHAEIELALVRLYRVTGQEHYLKLARFFVEQRGHTTGRPPQGDYSQDHLPIREQAEIVGHAVRAMYLYSAVADLAALTDDPGYLAMLERIWRDVTQRKMYITGGIGPSAQNEGFTVPYDLPNDSAYAETCASIGMALWNHRLTLLHADARYADVVERVMYNGLLSGVALEGDKFFYVNPLASRGGHHRQPWFDCACCPTNVVRFLPTVGGYVYAHTAQSIYISHYIAGEGRVPLGGRSVTLKQQTRYPWEGAVKISIGLVEPAWFALRLRMPGWCQGPQSSDDLYQIVGKPESGAVALKINGEPVEKIASERGYAVLEREWKPGDTVELELAMPVRRVKAHPKVQADAGRVALQRGPIVYCLEAVDNEGSVRNLALPPDTSLVAEFRPDLLNGVCVLKGTALARSAAGAERRPVEFTAVPYCAWDNRAPGQMVVWLPEDPAQAERPPSATIASQSKVSASHCHAADALEALNDQVEPTGSGDHNIPRFTWWDHKGTSEWVQLDFRAPCRVSGVAVYWFDDTGRGACRVPQSWRLLYREGETWKPVEEASEFGTRTDAYNRTSFKSVQTAGLRIEVQLQPGFSGGILEWRVNGQRGIGP